jgi:uncharacterized membrane protein
VTTQSALEGPGYASGHHAEKSRRSAVHVGGVAALTALIAAIYAGYSLVLYATYRESSYDLVYFDQVVRSFAHFHLGISILEGTLNGYGSHFSVLGNHFSPILAALAPLYWIYNGPQTLLVAQAVLFALAIPPLWIFTRRAFGGGTKATTAAYLICVAYGLSWPIAAAAAFTFHEVAFAPVLTAIALERLQAGRLRTALIALAGLLLVKEDMGLLVAGLGVYLAISVAPTLRRQRVVGLAFVAGGLAYTAFATYVLIPAFGGLAGHYWAYSDLGNNVPQVVAHIIRHPLGTLRLLVRPQVKLQTIKWLLAVFCFLPLLSPLVVAALPLIAERMLNSKYPNWWGVHFQYNAFIVVILVFAAVDGAARLDRWASWAWDRVTAGPKPSADAVPAVEAAGLVDTGPVGTRPVDLGPVDAVPVDAVPVEKGPVEKGPVEKGRGVRSGVVAVGCCVAIVAATLFTLPRFALGEALHANFYVPTPAGQAAAAADAVVPTGVPVQAATDVAAELSSRDTVLGWGWQQPALGSAWVVADVQRHLMTFTSVLAQRERVALLIHNGYKIVFERDGFVVLHRTSSPASV